MSLRQENKAKKRRERAPQTEQRDTERDNETERQRDRENETEETNNTTRIVQCNQSIRGSKE